MGEKGNRGIEVLDFMNYAKHLPAETLRQKLFASIYIVCIFKFISFAFQFVKQIVKVALQPAGVSHTQIRI